MGNKIFLTILFISTLYLVVDSANAQGKWAPVFGVVNNNADETVCLAIQNSKLEIGTKVQIVLAEKPQKVEWGVILGKVTKRCSSQIDFAPNLTFYRMRMSNPQDLTLGIAVVGTRKIKVNKGIAHSDLTRNRNDEYFYTCGGYEGTHLSVWTGKPSVGRIIWHAYYYVPYDTVPTCKKKDFPPTE